MSSRYASTTPVVRSSSADDDSTDRPKLCEIPGCRTLYLGQDAAGKDHHACGKADVFVNDRRGNKRGICAEHYARGIAAAGQASNQDLLGPNGRLNLGKVREFRSTLPEPKSGAAQLLGGES